MTKNNIDYNKLKDIMDEKGITTSDLARMTKIPQSTLNKIVNGDTINTKPSNVVLICAMLGIQEKDLIPSRPNKGIKDVVCDNEISTRLDGIEKAIEEINEGLGKLAKIIIQIQKQVEETKGGLELQRDEINILNNKCTSISSNVNYIKGDLKRMKY